MRPTESGTMCSLAVSRSLRFIARIRLSLPSCESTPTSDPEEVGPHCFGGVLFVTRRCVGHIGFRRLVVASGAASSASFPSTLVAIPWIADHEFPQIPDSVADVSRRAFGACADRFEATLGREGWERGMGEAALELSGEPPLSLVATVLYSSSMDIRRRVRGRNDELVGVELVCEGVDPLVRCMAFVSRAELVTAEQHRMGLRAAERKRASHQVTCTLSKGPRARVSGAVDVC
jgi:hypothetical protein